MSDIITTLHPENDESTNLYPNIKKENIPNKSITKDKLDDAVNSLLNSINELHPSGVDTSSNILAFTENKGIYIGSDTNYWYYWDGTNYVAGGPYLVGNVRIQDVFENIMSLSGSAYFGSATINSKTFTSVNFTTTNSGSGIQIPNTFTSNTKYTFTFDVYGTVSDAVRIYPAGTSGGSTIITNSVSTDSSNPTHINITLSSTSIGNTYITYNAVGTLNISNFSVVKGDVSSSLEQRLTDLSNNIKYSYINTISNITESKYMGLVDYNTASTSNNYVTYNFKNTLFDSISSLSTVDVNISFDLIPLSTNISQVKATFRMGKVNGSTYQGNFTDSNNGYFHASITKTSVAVDYLFTQGFTIFTFVNTTSTGEVKYLITNLSISVDVVDLDYDDISSKYEDLGQITNYSESLINFSPLEYSVSHINNKSLLVIGDSISDSSLSYADKYYFDYLQEFNHDNIIKDGRNGTGYATSYGGYGDFYTRIQAYTYESPNYILVFGGTNDWFNASVLLGELGDTDTTFYGIVYKTIIALINKYPSAKIVMLTPIRRNETTYNSHGETLEQYADAIIETADSLGIYSYDLYRKAGLNPKISALKTEFFNDNTHPNNKGQKRLYEVISTIIQNI